MVSSEQIQQPVLDWTARNLHDEWKKFQQYISLIIQGPMNIYSPNERAEYILIWVAPTGRNILTRGTVMRRKAKTLISL